MRSSMMKVDVLALGMLTCIRKCFDLIADHKGERWELATIPQDDDAGLRHAVPRGIARRVPGRKPRPDEHAAAVEAAHLLRSRHRGRDRAPRPDPGRHGASLSEAPEDETGGYRISLSEGRQQGRTANVLHKTLGVPLFQEQAMRIAIEAAEFTSEEANGLRRAMATFRNVGTIGKFEDKMVDNMIARGYDPEFAKTVSTRSKALAPTAFRKATPRASPNWSIFRPG